MRLPKDHNLVTFAYLTSDHPVPDSTNVWTLVCRLAFSMFTVGLMIVPLLVVALDNYLEERRPGVSQFFNRIFPTVHLTDYDDVENDYE